MHVTRIEKEKFLLSFCENDFRDKVVRRLFHAIGFSDGRDLCGPDENGRDAVFREVDRFGTEEIVAVQTKTGSVTLAGDPTKNLHEILSQLRTALNHPYSCVMSKKSQLPQKVFLAASGVINEKARTYICDHVNDPRIRFLDRDDIISQIDEKCPEIWSGIVAELTPYFNAFAARVDQLSISIQDLNPVQSAVGAFVAAGDGKFVDLKLGYQKIVTRKVSGRVYEDIDFEELSGTKLFSGTSVRALVLGDAGSGKSTLMIRLAYLLAKAANVSTKNYKVPIFVRAHELVGTGGESVFETLSKVVVKNYALQGVPFSIEDFEDGRVVLMIDALDELSEDKDRQEVIDFALDFSSKYSNCSLALTTRPYSSVDRLKGLDRFARYRVSPLSVHDASRMLKNIDGEGVVSADWRRETLRKLGGIHGVELNPLLVTVFAISTKVDKRDVPANITELFAKFTELLLGRWDERKGLSHQYQSKVKEGLLSEFAFRLHCDGRSTFSRRDFYEFSRVRLDEINLSADLDLLVHEILDRSGLLRGDNEVEFKHHLLQEYFAAKGIPDLDFVKDHLADDWWRNAVVFYFGERPRAVGDLLDAATSARNSNVDSFIAVGLALQACYMSRLEEKLDVWKWVNGAAVRSMRDFQSSLEDEKYPISSFLTGYLEARDALALGGIEDGKSGIEQWCEKVGYKDEAHRFWFAVGLSGLGEFELLEGYLEKSPIKDVTFLTALHFGCYYASELRELSGEAKAAVSRILEQLGPVVAVNRVRITEELKGQLLEYRNGGVVALDAIER